MKFLVDTCGWIEYMANASLANKFAPYLKHLNKLVIPTIVQFELYRWICREKDESEALNIIGLTEQCEVIPLNTSIALYAADLAKLHGLAMADAIVYATGMQYQAKIVTCDAHFVDFPQVEYFSTS